jgi:FAD-dependent urate hydroxylase
MAALAVKLEIPADFSMEERLRHPTPLPGSGPRLRALESSIQADRALLKYPREPLPYVRNDSVLEVAIIGAGQTGKSVAFGLERYGYYNVRAFDRRPRGRQGPWRTYARNHLLRTRKSETGGLEWGIPNLHFQRWSEAKFGPDYFQNATRIHRFVWADYLDWYGEVLNLPIEYEVDITDVSWRPDLGHFELSTSKGPVHAQFVVVCTGIESAGLQRFPELVTQVLPRSAYSHTMDDLPADALMDRDVVVVGGGASAFDTANAALEAGARSVDLMVRRRGGLPPIHRVCLGSRWNAYHRHYIELTDAMKWAYSLADLDLGVPPPRDTYYEAIRDPRFNIYDDAPIEALAYANGKIVGSYGGSQFRHDFMICGTGSRNSIADQRELKSLLPFIRLWRDGYIPNGMARHPELESSPYLGPALQFTPKDQLHAFVGKVYYLCSGVAHLSGFRCNISGLQYAATRVCHDISKTLFLAHADEVKAAFDSHSAWE